MQADYQKLTRVYELNQKRKKPIDFSNHIHELGVGSVHNGFHYEALSFARNSKDEALVKYFEDRIQALEEQMADNELSE